jgi:nucleotide-binding universal stress UspA family protein
MTTVEAGKRIALSNILFATDFSLYSNAALPYALAIAHLYEAKVYGAHIVSSGDYLFTAPELWPAHLQQEEELQKEVTARIEEQLRCVPHQALVGVGDVWSALSKLIGGNAIDLLVVGTHGRTGTRKLLMGSVAEEIFRQAACPVLSVGPNVPLKTEGKIKFQRILFATNFGEESLAALPYALSLAEEDQAELTLLHVVEQPVAGVPRVEEVKASLSRRLAELVPLDAASWCRVGYLIEFGHQFARPAERIVEVARDRAADLIVLGVRPIHGTVGAVTHVAHTAAQDVLAHAVCPVLTVRN